MSFDTRFRRSTIFFIRKKFLDIDMLDIDSTSIEGHDIPNWDDCVDGWFDSGSGPFGTLISKFSPNHAKDPLIVNIDSS